MRNLKYPALVSLSIVVMEKLSCIKTNIKKLTESYHEDEVPDDLNAIQFKTEVGIHEKKSYQSTIRI